jgi:hypothetical protein
MLDSIIDENGIERFLGNNLPLGRMRYSWSVYGDSPKAPMVSRSEWPALITEMGLGYDHPHLGYVHYQGSIGQCNADATASLAEFCRSMQGLSEVKLSAADLYGCINGGSDRGSMLEDAMSQMLRVGIGTVATCGTLWQGRRQVYASNEERAKYKATEIWLCPTFDHCMSAVLMGFGLVSGIMWHNNYSPDSDGWLPARGRGMGGGHAVFGYKPAMRNNKYGIWHQNSWGEWGLNKKGKCVFPEEVYDHNIGGWWAVRQMVTEEGDVPPPRSLLIAA